MSEINSQSYMDYNNSNELYEPNEINVYNLEDEEGNILGTYLYKIVDGEYLFYIKNIEFSGLKGIEGNDNKDQFIIKNIKEMGEVIKIVENIRKRELELFKKYGSNDKFYVEFTSLKGNLYIDNNIIGEDEIIISYNKLKKLIPGKTYHFYNSILDSLKKLINIEISKKNRNILLNKISNKK